MEIKNLTSFIMSILPAAKVFISCPVLRLDDRKANATLRKLGEYFKGITNDIILNDMIIVMQFSDIIFKIGFSSRLFFE